jgi:hypothetical protein
MRLLMIAILSVVVGAELIACTIAGEMSSNASVDIRSTEIDCGKVSVTGRPVRSEIGSDRVRRCTSFEKRRLMDVSFIVDV